jgi:hypothetical protein
MLDMAVLQHAHSQIYQVILTHLLNPSVESPQVGKYGVIALQFLLHSKTEAQWNNASPDEETTQAWSLLMSCLIDKKEKVQKQAQKSMCILMQNKKIDRLIRPLAAF